LNPRPDYVNGTGPDVLISSKNLPYAGWRWGNRGTVASAAIEKPHRSGWRPLLETEFDLAYSPLMELDYGKGKIVWSQLDLEDHAALDSGRAASCSSSRELCNDGAPRTARGRELYWRRSR
jgi:beta-galactosidase